jgi:hypothetical protein
VALWAKAAGGSAAAHSRAKKADVRARCKARCPPLALVIGRRGTSR